MKKSSKRFVISTETKNDKDFSVRTEGIDTSEYHKNPLMLLNHKWEEILPLGNFIELAFEGKTLYGTPNFDDTDEFAMKIYNKVENGTIRMASAGLLPIKLKRDDKGHLWLWESKLVEVSICPVGSNPDALAVQLYDDHSQVITLSAEYLKSFNIDQFTDHKTKIDMEIIELTASEVLPVLSLSEGASPVEVQLKINNLATLASTQAKTILTLTADKDTADKKVEELNGELKKQVELANTQKITTLMATAVSERKITAEESTALIELAAGDFGKLEKLMSTKTATPTLKEVLDKSKGAASEGLEKLSWDDMDKSGQLVQLKADNLELFKTKYQEKFKKAYES